MLRALQAQGVFHEPDTLVENEHLAGIENGAEIVTRFADVIVLAVGGSPPLAAEVRALLRGSRP